MSTRTRFHAYRIGQPVLLSGKPCRVIEQAIRAGHPVYTVGRQNGLRYAQVRQRHLTAVPSNRVI